MTPQLIQSMAILQKPIAELEAYVHEALESNPALDVAEPEAKEEQPPHRGANGRAKEADERQFARLDRFARAYEWDGSDGMPPRMRASLRDGERDAKLDAMANTAGRPASLQEHLLRQWALVEVEPPVRRAGEIIIDRFDPDGYLRVPLEELAAVTRPQLAAEVFQEALEEVQQLDPAGVGARDLKECLCLQLDRMPGDNLLEWTLVQEHLDDIAQNRLPAIARARDLPLGEINEAIRVIRTLHPSPGTLIEAQAEPPIRPDAIVEYGPTGRDMVVRLVRGNLPPLQIRPEVVALARNPEGKREDKEYAKRQVDAAEVLIDAVAFRQRRLLEVARLIAERQRDFFDTGPQGLKVLRMGEVAEEMQCDPSTVSRCVAGKYMQTPWGIYPMRYFFASGTETDDGSTASWDRVRLRVKELVDTEDRSNPLKDDELAARLSQEGIDISRRTVAKYRQQLGIPSTRQRRSFEQV